MATFRVTIACSMRAYGNLEIEADDIHQADKRVEEIVRTLNQDGYVPELEDTVFNPEYGEMQDYEALPDLASNDDDEEED